MKTMKFRIEPNSEQRSAIDHNIEANRLVYNNFLTACRSVYDDTGRLPTVFDLNKLGTRMRHDCAFVAEAYSLTLNETAKRALTACQRTLAEHMHSWGVYNLETGFSKDPFHFPRYRSRTQFDSFTYPSARDYSIVT